MNTRFLAAATVALVSLHATAQDNGPTMGWSSWNTYGVNINESLIRRQALAIVNKGLLAVGYNHINIDDGYFGGRDQTDGHLLIHPERFPNGLKPLVEYIHSKGLKAGIYSDAGRNTCGSKFNGDLIGRGVGMYEHDQQDADFFFKDMGFDFIKVDFCGGSWFHNDDHLVLDEKERYMAIAQAIRNTGRTDVRMNACRWDYPGTWINDAAFSWRTTGDIYDGWESVKGIIQQNLYLAAYSSKGHFNDMDMLEVGRSLTSEEDKTHFGLWCIMNSPLLIGCDLTNIRTEALTLLKNKELIALNQDTLYQQAYVAGLIDGCHLLVRDIEKRNGLRRALAIYNPSDEEKTVELKFDDIDLAGEVLLRDVFKRRDIGSFQESFSVQLPAHGTRIYVAEGSQRLERRRYEAETAYISDYQEIKNNQAEKTGIYEAANYCSSGFKAGWLGASAKNDLRWRDVYSVEGGEYKLTIAFVCGESRKLDVNINGTKVQTLTLNSGNWQKVGRKTINVRLDAGRNEIRLSNSSSWMPDIDYVELECTLPANISVPDAMQRAHNRAYNLQGQPIDPSTASGIIIQNGRKVFCHY